MEHKFYKLAYSAYRNVSFTPDERAEKTCKMYDELCAELVELGKADKLEKFEKLFTRYLSTKSRCASSAIVGGSGFNVQRAEKRNLAAHKAEGEMWSWLGHMRKTKPEPRTELDYAIEDKEYKIGEVTVKQNTEQNRLQFIFPGKPEAAMIEKLKRNGFKWSPRNTAWQRQLTPNALRVVPHILTA